MANCNLLAGLRRYFVNVICCCYLLNNSALVIIAEQFDSNTYQVTKCWIALVNVLFIAALYLFFHTKKRDKSFVLGKASISYFIIVLLLIGTSLYQQNFSNNLMVFVFLFSNAIFFFLMDILKEDYNREKGLTIIVAVMLLSILFAFIHDKTGLFYITFTNKVIFNNYLCLLIVTFNAAQKDSNSKALKYFAWALFCLGSVLAIYCDARAALLMYTISLLVATQLRYRFKTAAISVVTGIFLLMIVYVATINKQNSSEGRYFILKNSIQLFTHHALTGIGLNRFQSEYNLQQASYFNSGKQTKKEEYLAGNVFICNNEFLQMLVELGLPMALAIFVLTGYIAYGQTRNYQVNKQAFLRAAIYSNIVFFSLVSSPFRIPVILSTVVGFLGYTSNSQNSGIDFPGWLKSMITVILPVYLIGFTTIILVEIKAINNWERVDYKFALEADRTRDYAKLHQRLRWNRNFLWLYALALNDQGNYSKALTVIDEFLRVRTSTDFLMRKFQIQSNGHRYSDAIATAKLITHIAPNKFVPKYELFRLYVLLNDSVKAKQMAEEIGLQKVKVPDRVIVDIKTRCNIFLTNTH